MSVQSEVNRLRTAKTELTSVLEAYGVTVPSSTTLDDYPSLIAKVLQNGSAYLYKALFLVDGWSGRTNYTQTVSVTPLAGAPAIASNFIMASGIYVEDTYPDSTQEIISESGGIVDKGTKTIGDGTITCTTRSGQKPTSDVEVFFLAKIES